MFFPEFFKVVDRDAINKFIFKNVNFIEKILSDINVNSFFFDLSFFTYFSM